MELFGAGLDFADALHFASKPSEATFVTFDDTFVRRAKIAGATGIVNPSR